MVHAGKNKNNIILTELHSEVLLLGLDDGCFCFFFFFFLFSSPWGTVSSTCTWKYKYTPTCATLENFRKYYFLKLTVYFTSRTSRKIIFPFLEVKILSEDVLNKLQNSLLHVIIEVQTNPFISPVYSKKFTNSFIIIVKFFIYHFRIYANNILLLAMK